MRAASVGSPTRDREMTKRGRTRRSLSWREGAINEWAGVGRSRDHGGVRRRHMARSRVAKNRRDTTGPSMPAGSASTNQRPSERMETLMLSQLPKEEKGGGGDGG